MESSDEPWAAQNPSEKYTSQPLATSHVMNPSLNVSLDVTYYMKVSSINWLKQSARCIAMCCRKTRNWKLWFQTKFMCHTSVIGSGEFPDMLLSLRGTQPSDLILVYHQNFKCIKQHATTKSAFRRCARSIWISRSWSDQDGCPWRCLPGPTSSRLFYSETQLTHRQVWDELKTDKLGQERQCTTSDRYRNSTLAWSCLQSEDRRDAEAFIEWLCK